MEKGHSKEYEEDQRELKKPEEIEPRRNAYDSPSEEGGSKE